MTAVGKILVFINLLFSLLVGGLVTMVYVARTHWVAEFAKLDAQYKIAVASEQTYKAEADKSQKDADLRVASAKDQMKTSQEALAKALERIKTMRDDNAAQDRKFVKGETSTAVSLVEVTNRQASEEKLKETLRQEIELNNKLVLDRNAQLEKAVGFEIALKTSQDRAQRLEGQLQDLTKELVRMRSSGGSPTRVAGSKNPPPENVEGLVRNTDPSGLVTLTIGSDAGLTKGHTLEVYRLSNIPNQSKYLGTIRILEVTATQAVGQPTGRMTTPPQAGDRVASHILGGV